MALQLKTRFTLLVFMSAGLCVLLAIGSIVVSYAAGRFLANEPSRKQRLALLAEGKIHGEDARAKLKYSLELEGMYLSAFRTVRKYNGSVAILHLLVAAVLIVLWRWKKRLLAEGAARDREATLPKE